MAYYITTDPMSGTDIVIRLEGNVMTSFTENEASSEWRAYQEWLAEGNTPEPWPRAES